MSDHAEQPEQYHDSDLIVPPVGGADTELANFIEGNPDLRDTCSPAATAILAEVDGLPSRDTTRLHYSGGYGYHDTAGNGGNVGTAGRSSGGGFNPQDWCRKFLACNGSCIYIDLGHTEFCVPEVTSASDFVTYWHAMLRIVRLAQEKADRKLPPGQRIHVLVNNSDGLGHSYGAHLNFLVHRKTFENLFRRKMHFMLWLASYQVSSIVITGQGKVGSENDRDPVAFQLSQRADFFEMLTGLQTTHHRPLINERDEPLCGPLWRNGSADRPWARLHVIFYDANLSHVACYLKFGILQIILAMIAAGRVNHRLILEDPVHAVVSWSHDISLRRRMPMLSGAQLTVVELQMLFLEEARRFVDGGTCNVPEANRILDLWQDTLVKLEAGAIEELASRLDWALKLSTLTAALEQRPDLTWSSPKIKTLDHLYSSLDPQEGLYWRYEQANAVERIADNASIERAMVQPPDGTRAYTRAMLLRRADPASVDAVNWDWIDFSFRNAGSWPRRRTIEMSDPLGLTRSETEQAFGHTDTVSDALDALGVA